LNAKLEEDEETRVRTRSNSRSKIAQGGVSHVRLSTGKVKHKETETETETQYDVGNLTASWATRVSPFHTRASDTGSSDVDMAYEWIIDTIVQN
jgi:hypothetical protein